MPSPHFVAWLDALLPPPKTDKPKPKPTINPTEPKGAVMTTTGTTLAAEGAQRAADHADRVKPGWSEFAYAALSAVAHTYPEFTTESVRLAFAGIVEDAPDNRAWGSVVRRAKVAGLCRFDRVEKAVSKNVHGGWVTVWKSNVYKGGPVNG